MGQKKRLELGVLLGEGKGDITVWGIKDLFWADRFFRGWKNLLKSSWNRIAPLFERQDENQELPTVNDLLELYRQSNEIRALDREITRSFRKYKNRRRINPRHGWWLAMDRGRFRGVNYVG